MFSFKELCEDNRGSTDYMAVAQNFKTIFLRGVPVLSSERRDFLRRFILLIDALYYNHRNVIIEAEVEIDQIFKFESGSHDK